LKYLLFLCLSAIIFFIGARNAITSEKLSIEITGEWPSKRHKKRVIKGDFIVDPDFLTEDTNGRRISVMGPGTDPLCGGRIMCVYKSGKHPTLNMISSIRAWWRHPKVYIGEILHDLVKLDLNHGSFELGPDYYTIDLMQDSNERYYIRWKLITKIVGEQKVTNVFKIKDPRNNKWIRHYKKSFKTRFRELEPYNLRGNKVLIAKGNFDSGNVPELGWNNVIVKSDNSSRLLSFTLNNTPTDLIVDNNDGKLIFSKDELFPILFYLSLGRDFWRNTLINPVFYIDFATSQQMVKHIPYAF